MDVDEKDQVMQTMSSLKIRWEDKKLTWIRSLYGNVKTMTVRQEQVWAPDVVVYNTADPHQVLGYKQLPVRIFSNGTLEWIPNIVTRTQCDIVVTNYPFDTQICEIEISAVVSAGREIDLQPTSLDVNMDFYQEDGTWEVVNTSMIDKSMYAKEKGRIVYR